MNFFISDKQGYNYSIKSGDKNKIHLDNLTGYNSLFGQKVCHGTLVLQKALELLKINKKLNRSNEFFIEINFLKHFVYNKKINIKKNTLKISQKDNGFATLKIKKKNNFENIKFHKKQFYSNFNKNLSLNNFEILVYLLDKLTHYVGMIYPGEYSMINDIKINYNNKSKFSKKKIFIYSKKLVKKFPIINNKLVYKNFIIYFTTSERPKLTLKKFKIGNSLKNKIKKIIEPIVIIGASSGIGLEMFKLFKINKTVPIIGTFNKNKIFEKNSNIKFIKLDLYKNISILKEKLKNFNSLRIYYFATSKIELNLNNKKKIFEYNNFYINFPIKIISFFKDKKIKFFYPSSIYINKTNSDYANVKKRAENILKKYQNKKCKINILRLAEINTKQNLSLIRRNLPSFSELLDKNLKYQKKIFFD
jgi:hypothetical protein